MKKRIFAIFLCICAVVACEGLGDGESGGRNPLEECVIPVGASPGEEAVIQWNGFGQSPSVALRDADGKDFSVDVKVVTSSGLIFTVPSGIAPGMYSVVLQGQGVVLGQMEILPTDMPVTGISVPSAVVPGEALVIKGTGFDSSFRFLLRSGALQIELLKETVAGGVSCNVPSDVPLGTYRLVMTDGEDEWVLEDGFMVARRKRLMKIREEIVDPEAGTVEVYEYRNEYDGDEVKAVVSDYKLNDFSGQVVDSGYEYRYVQIAAWDFNIEGDISEKTETCNYNFKYIFDDTGKLVNIDALVFRRNQSAGEQRMHWCEYDSHGRLAKILYDYNGAVQSRQTYIYDSDNLVETYWFIFMYENETLTNHPFAVDAAIGYDMFHLENMDQPLIYVPYLLGAHPFASRLLPTGAQSAGYAVKFEYGFDADGYVTLMSWNGGNSRIHFVYE